MRMRVSPDKPDTRSAFDIYSLSTWRRKRRGSEYDIYPSFNRRMIAATLDSLVLMVLTPVFNRLAPIDYSGMGHIAAPEGQNPAGFIALQMLSNRSFVASWMQNFTLQLMTFLLYSAICWYLWAATPGKMVMRMKVVDAGTNGPITPLQILLRLCGYVVSGMCAMLGFFWIGASRRRRGWHDYLAGTAVITAPWRITRTPAPPAAPEPQDVKPDETAAD